MSAVTLHMFIRPGTPAGAAAPVVIQMAELWEFGLLGPGSRVWANLELPNALWVLSDRSTFLRIVDVPTAGWVRLTQESAAWAPRHRATTTPAARKVFTAEDMPIPLQDRDLVTVALRNADQRCMRATFNGGTHDMTDFETTHGQMRAVDFKPGGFQRKAPLAAPSEREAAHAVLRGMDLLSATEPTAYQGISDHIEAFTATVDVDEFDRLRAVQQRAGQLAEGLVDPIEHRVDRLGIIPTGRDEAAAS